MTIECSKCGAKFEKVGAGPTGPKAKCTKCKDEAALEWRKLHPLKVCTKCKILKPTTTEIFSFVRGYVGNLSSWCKKCVGKRQLELIADSPQLQLKRKNIVLKHRHGITLDEFEEMAEAQDNRCVVCGSKETCSVKESTNGAKKRSLHVDHCERCRTEFNKSKSESIRGLTCHACNSGLGYFNHDPSILKSAIKYLQKFQRKNTECSHITIRKNQT